MPELILTLPDGRTRRLPLGAEPVVFGRDDTCDVKIDDQSASRRHIRFTRTAAGHVVEDLGSKNGTLVNNEPCTQKSLTDGDQILIGSTLIRYCGTTHSSTYSVTITEEESAAHATRYVSRDQQLLISQKHLRMIYDLAEQLTMLQSRDHLLERAMQICFETLKFERGAIGVRGIKERAVQWPFVRNLRSAEGELRISRTLLNRALEHGERAIFTEGGAGSSDPTVSMVQQGIRSAMCVPLISTDGILGVVYGDRTTTSATYTQEDIDFLAGIARLVSIGLINCRLLEEQRETVRLNHEIDLARSIQTGLFPTKLPNRKDLRVAAINDPGQRVSGDYYDVIDAGDGRVWCLMADVSGKGVAAALLMANFQAAVRVTIQETLDPGELLRRWNGLTFHNTKASKFITCILALIDPSARRVHVASAGHAPPIIIRSAGDGPQEIQMEPGFPLGVVPETEFITHPIDLGPGPVTYFCYTDGVTEAFDADQQLFGKDRLIEVLGSLTELNPQPLVKQVRIAVSRFADQASQSDDITILAVRVT